VPLAVNEVRKLGTSWSGVDIRDNDMATFHSGGNEGFLGQSTEDLYLQNDSYLPREAKQVSYLCWYRLLEAAEIRTLR
jgi:hypothetical protein